MITMTLVCRVIVLLRNFISHSYFPYYFQTKLMGSVIVFLEFPTWEWHYDPALDSLLLMARVTLRVYIFFHHLFGLSRMSRHFNPWDSCDISIVYESHLEYLFYAVRTHSGSDTSMATMLSIEVDPSKATFCMSSI